MKNILTFDEYVSRIKQLMGIKTSQKTYLIKITILGSDSLLEHECLTTFKNSTNKYLYHAEKSNPPVRAHYHIYPSNGKNEIYAVNVVDGTAHHKRNRGYIVPKKEADELKALGVAIKDNRIIEFLDFLETEQRQLLNESIKPSNEFIYLMISE